MFKGARKFLKRVAERLLDIDDTSVPASHLRMFEDYLGKFEFDTSTADVKQFLNVLKRKHLVDDIVVASLNGSAIASTNGNSVASAVSGAALYNYVRSELPKSETVMIRSPSTNSWHMLFPCNRKLYIVKASSDLSIIELKALANEIDKFLIGKAAN